MIRLDSATTVVAHLHGAVSGAGLRVRVGARLDRAGQGALVAFPADEVSNMTDDRQLREMSCDPRLRKVLVTDATTAVGQSLVHAFLAAGASQVWAGCAGARASPTALDALKQLENVRVLSLDVTDVSSVKNAAAQVGTQVDILVNNAEYHRAHDGASPSAADGARAEMEVNYFGLLRLAQQFGPAMRARGTGADAGAVAWVNVLSVFALSSLPAQGTFSASKAAAFSLAQSQRAELGTAGIRVVNVFPGPIDEAGTQSRPSPNLSADALAHEIVKALQDGIEDVYPGDVAQDWFARWRDNPKALERELAAAR
jgi:NAD(P)-dependent dehydrogenase (short-subunit alcohol dehydrogenase family)